MQAVYSRTSAVYVWIYRYILKQLLDLVFCYCYDDEEIYSLYRVQQIFMQKYEAFMLNDRATCSVQGHLGAPSEFSEVYKYLRKAVFHVLLCDHAHCVADRCYCKKILHCVLSKTA